MWFARKRAARRGAGVESEIRYLRERSVRPRIDAAEPAKSVVSASTHRVFFHDLRGSDEPPSLDAEGFALLPHRSNVANFHDRRQHVAYRQELEQLMREVTGSASVFLSPMMVLRSRNHSQPADGVIADRIAGLVHSDRTDRSVWSEARAALRAYGIETIPAGRLVAYNVWRALSPPPQDYPLALCDLRTVREEHLVRADSVGDPTSGGEVLEFYLPLFDPGHRWCYFSNLTRDEVLVFQQYDTAAAAPSGCPHVAFHDPAGNAAVTRLSIEARAYVFFPS